MGGEASSLTTEPRRERQSRIIAANDEIAVQARLFAASPAFPEAVRQYTIGAARFRETPRFVNKLVSSDARWRVVGYLLYLAADRETFGSLGGATYGRLLQLCTRRQEVSPRVLKTVLALLIFTGFVETLSDGVDRRLKYYRPTLRMREFTDQWLGYATSTLDILQPEGRRSQMMRSDPGFAERFFVSGGRSHACDAPLADRMPDFTAFFGEREGAAVILLVLMLAQLDGAAVPGYATIARRYGISKSQITKVFSEAEALGYLVFDATRMPRATERLRETFFRWVAIELAFYAQHMRAA